MWEQQRKAYVGSAEEVLGYRKWKSKPWMSKATWQLIDERKEIKGKIHSTKSERIKDRLKEIYKQRDKEHQGGQKKMDDREGTEGTKHSRKRQAKRAV